MNPYYQDAAVTIYHGDCREILPVVSADVLVTDPPYGVELGTSDSRGNNHGLVHASYVSYSDTEDNFRSIIIPAIRVALELTNRGAIFVGKHLTAFPEPSIAGGIYCSAACGRNPWGFTNLLAVFFYGSNPRLHLGAVHTVIGSNETAERNGHPCPKPLGWMTWLVGMTSLDGETILDPFMGSGTTLRAAKDLGRKAIGIEIEERYCEIAANRMAQEVLAL